MAKFDFQIQKKSLWLVGKICLSGVNCIERTIVKLEMSRDKKMNG